MRRAILTLTSVFALLLIWIGIKFGLSISDRYLPSPLEVVSAIDDIRPSLVIHTVSTALRVALGFLAGSAAGIIGALIAFRFGFLRFLTPSIQAMRAIPPIAIIPFFLLWFGFSEVGRILILVLGLGLNVFVACANVLVFPSERERILFASFDKSLNTQITQYWLPRVVETLLPTLRFGLATIIGLAIVAEMLGSQLGLGYLIQTSRSTFSLDVIFLCSGLLGIMTAVFDAAVVQLWRRVVYWKR